MFSIPFLEHSVSLHLFRSLIIFLSAFCTFQHTYIGYDFIRFIINYFILKTIWWLRWLKICLWHRRPGFDPWSGRPGSGRSPGEGLGNPLQYSYLENSVSRACWAEPWGLKESCVTEWLTLSLFLILKTIVNGIIFLIMLSTYLFLVSKNVNFDVHMFIVHK